MTAPEYLLKFVPKYEHAESLVNGIIFTRPAGYYIALEQGQGDWQESTIVSGMMCYKNYNMPIYCMVGVQQEEISGGVYKIDNRIVRDFHCECGYVVIMRYSDFNARLPIFEDGKRGYCGYVEYRTIEHDETPQLLIDSTGINLGIKNPELYYQHEYRVVFPEHLFSPIGSMITEKRYHMTCSLQGLAQIVSISVLRDDTQYRYLELR